MISFLAKDFKRQYNCYLKGFRSPVKSDSFLKIGGPKL